MLIFANETIKQHDKKYKDVYPSDFIILNSRLYVYYLIHNLEDTDLTYTINEQTKLILGEAGFNMTTNVHSFQDRFMEEDNNEPKSCNVLGFVVMQGNARS